MCFESNSLQSSMSRFYFNCQKQAVAINFLFNPRSKISNVYLNREYVLKNIYGFHFYGHFNTARGLKKFKKEFKGIL